MAENWKQYFTSIDDKLASVSFDLGIEETGAKRSHPYLLIITVNLLQPRDDGLSSQLEFDALFRIDESLNDSLAENCGAIYVGRVTTAGHRDFCFYAKTDAPLRGTIETAEVTFPKYTVKARSQRDEEWAFYFDVLYPSAEEMQSLKNMDLLGVLNDHGDTLDEPRNVDHWIYFRRESDRDTFAKDALELGYQIVGRAKLDKGDRPFSLQICRVQNLSPDSIDEAVLELFRMAADRDAEYDGWETQVISTKN